MQGAGWKLTALAACLAVGFVVLMQVQQSLDSTPTAQNAADEKDPSADNQQDDQAKTAKSDQPDLELFPVESFNPGNDDKLTAFVPDQNAEPGQPGPFVPEKKQNALDPFSVSVSKKPAQEKLTASKQPLTPPVAAESLKPEVDPFAAFTQKLEQQENKKRNEPGNLTGNAINSIVKKATKSEPEDLQWSSGIDLASHKAGKKEESKMKLVAGAFPESAPLTNAVHETPAANGEKTPSQELIELTQNLSSKFPAVSKSKKPPKTLTPHSGFPALSVPQATKSEPTKEKRPQFPSAQSGKAVPQEKSKSDSITITPGSFPVSSFEAANDSAQPVEMKPEPVEDVVPSGLQGFPAPSTGFPATSPMTKPSPKATAELSDKKPFFEGFPESTDKKASSPDAPYRLVPEFNTEKPAKEMKTDSTPKAEKTSVFPASTSEEKKADSAPLAFPGQSASGKSVPSAKESAFPSLTTIKKKSPEPAGFPEAQPETALTPVKESDPDLIGSARVDPKLPGQILQPKVDLYKSAPEKSVLGQPLIYTIEIENTGKIAVKDVKVEDKVPAGTKLTGTIPRAELIDKTLVWKFEELSPGERKKILVRVVPIEAGKIGSTSTVSFKSSVSAQTMITAPKLELLLKASEQVAVGETAELHFVARNTGNGDAVDVVLRNLIPAGFEHPAGTDLEYDLGTIKGGEEKKVSLQLNAKKPGTYQNLASIKSAGGLKAEVTSDLEIIPAVLGLIRKSPSRRFVGHAMQQTTTLKNNSRKLLKDVTVIEHVPAGFEFRKASESGLYSKELRTISWTITELAAGEEFQVSSTLVPTTVGTQKIKIKALDASGHQAELEASTKVEGFASLAVRVPDAHGPVALGEKVSLRFKVINKGSAEATRVIVTCKIPDQLKYVSANGPVKALGNGQFVTFQPIGSLGANQEATFDLVFSSVKSGDGNVEFEVASEQSTTPLKHHEQVVIFGD